MEVPSCARFKKFFKLILSLSRTDAKRSSACKI